MTRKDYIVIAEALRDCYSRSLDIGSTASPQAVSTVADRIACSLANDNPKFNREHFLAVVTGDKPVASRPSKGGAL